MVRRAAASLTHIFACGLATAPLQLRRCRGSLIISDTGRISNWVGSFVFGLSAPSRRARRSQHQPLALASTHRKTMETTTNKNDNYMAKDGLFGVRKTRCARRWPQHDFPVVVVTLRPRRGTRVLPLAGGGVEWMPRYSEVLALILQLGLNVSPVPPDKPEERRLRWEKKNAQRHQGEGKQ